jgi:hypothetical protein
LKKPIHEQVGFERTLHASDEATKANLLSALSGKKTPAVVFTASHGLAIKAGQPNQVKNQGALLCQDWPGYGAVTPKQILSAADIDKDANVNGLVAFFFACFGAGTPGEDQFLMDLSSGAASPPLAPKPFAAALPSRLLSHPNGSALAVIGHVDRAWGFSIQPPNSTTPQIAPFRNSLGGIMTGAPVGHAMVSQFGQRYAALSAALLNAVAPTLPASARPTDQALVTFWIERNDAQNYVMLGDPAARVRIDKLA